MKRIYRAIKRRLSGIKSSILHDSEIPVGISNSVLNFFARRLFRYQYEKGYNFDFFNNFYNNRFSLGPLQRDEAIFLFGLLKVIRPKTCIEFGFHKGHSAFVILNAIGSESLLVSFDISPDAELLANKLYLPKHPNFRFLRKSQVDFVKEDCENQHIDFVFFDASHDFDLNLETFKKIKSNLSDNAFLVIHDTGLWNTKFMEARHFDVLPFLKPKEFVEGISHQNDERKFVNWILENNLNFNALHFNSINTLRHGMTVISNQNSILKV